MLFVNAIIDVMIILACLFLFLLFVEDMHHVNGMCCNKLFRETRLPRGRTQFYRSLDHTGKFFNVHLWIFYQINTQQLLVVDQHDGSTVSGGPVYSVPAAGRHGRMAAVGHTRCGGHERHEQTKPERDHGYRPSAVLCAALKD